MHHKEETLLASAGLSMISLLWIFPNLKARKMTLQKINDSSNSSSSQSHLTQLNSCSEACVRCQRVGVRPYTIGYKCTH